MAGKAEGASEFECEPIDLGFELTPEQEARLNEDARLRRDVLAGYAKDDYPEDEPDV